MIPDNDKANVTDFSLFQREENVIKESEAIMDKLGSVGQEFRSLTENYRQSYREQQRLIKMSDRLQMQLLDANAKLEAQAVEMQELNQSLQREIAERTKLTGELEKLANVDSLTEAFTRRYFFDLVAGELRRVKRNDQPMALLLADFDNFKEINDALGHHTGDRTLRIFGAEVRRQLREVDIFGRLGGEEFAIVLPETDQTSALNVAEKVRQSMERISTSDPELGLVTISIGVTMFVKNDRIEKALCRADQALYKAKNAGRNQVVSADDQH